MQCIGVNTSPIWCVNHGFRCLHQQLEGRGGRIIALSKGDVVRTFADQFCGLWWWLVQCWWLHSIRKQTIQSMWIQQSPHLHLLVFPNQPQQKSRSLQHHLLILPVQPQQKRSQRTPVMIVKMEHTPVIIVVVQRILWILKTKYWENGWYGLTKR